MIETHGVHKYENDDKKYTIKIGKQFFGLEDNRFLIHSNHSNKSMLVRSSDVACGQTRLEGVPVRGSLDNHMPTS